MFMLPRQAVGVFLAVVSYGLASAIDNVAIAAAPAWRDAAYPYSIINQNLANVLENFGYNTGLKVSVAQDVKGTVHGRASSGSAGQFLDEVTRSNDLDWYSDGTVVYVSPAADEETAVVPLHGFSFDRLRRHLADFDLLDRRFRFLRRRAGDVAILSGPPSYVLVVKQAIEAETGAKDQPDGPAAGTLVVFRGNASSSLKLP